MWPRSASHARQILPETLTNEEVHRLASIARNAGVPLIIDNAYGLPFPGILFRSADPIWDDNIILTLSLSKLGLPNTRTGIVVAQSEIIKRSPR